MATIHHMDDDEETMLVYVDGMIVSIERWLVPGRNYLRVFVHEGTSTKDVDVNITDNKSNNLANVAITSNKAGWNELNYKIMDRELPPLSDLAPWNPEAPGRFMIAPDDMDGES